VTIDMLPEMASGGDARFLCFAVVGEVQVLVRLLSMIGL